MLGSGAKKEPTDEEAMLRFKNGDARAFDLLLNRHSARVLRFIMKMIKSSHPQAEDLLQDVFLKVIEKRGKYNSCQKFTTWLYTLARNRCIDYLRFDKHRQHDSLDTSVVQDKSDGPVVLEFIKSTERNQEERAMDEQIHSLINKGIGNLREEYREVFLLREIEGLSLKEIAELTEVPLSTAKSRLRYAYRELREFFIDAGYFEEEKRAGEL